MAGRDSQGRTPRARSRPGPSVESEPQAEPRDGEAEQEQITPAPSTIAEYQVVSRLGSGGMADVFLAHKMSRFGFVRRAVIKRVRRSRPGFKSLQRMLLDEARATACFDHANLVSILDVGEDEQGVYLALEYVDGTDLRWVNAKLRARKEALPFELACFLVVEVLRGLHHAHTVRGPDGKPLEIVHRDVNPSNVLISRSGHVKLADFGVVRMRDRLQEKTEAGLVKGKYAYLAPEYIAGEACSHLTDIYATGVMLFELLSGRECFSGASAYEVMWKIVNRGVPLYRLEREGVPDDLCRIVQKATNPVPERRYASAYEMANALETWLMRSGRHATAWVLSVFFAKHELFTPPEERQLAESAPPSPAATPPVPEDRGMHETVREVAPKVAAPPRITIEAPQPELLEEEPPRARAMRPPSATVDLGLPEEVARGPHDQNEIRDAARALVGRAPPTIPEPQPSPSHPRIEAPVEAEEEPITPTSWPAQAEEPRVEAPTPARVRVEDGIPRSFWESGGAEAPRPGPPVAPSVQRERAEPPELGVAFEEPVERAGDRRVDVLGPNVPPLPPAPDEDLDPATLPDAITAIATPEAPERTGRTPARASAPPPADLTEGLVAPPAPAAAPAPRPDGNTLWSGKLEETSPAQALDMLAQAGASGSVEFRCGLIWKRIQLDAGQPVGITSNMGMELIGEHLVKARVLTRRELDRALHASERDGTSLTTKLLQLGMIDRSALEEELGKNLAARISEVLEWRWGTFEFSPQAPEVSEIRPRLDLASLIQAAYAQRSAEEAEPEESGAANGSSAQSKLKEAFKRARSITQSSGKGRVDQLGEAGARQPSKPRS